MLHMELEWNCSSVKIPDTVCRGAQQLLKNQGYIIKVMALIIHSFRFLGRETCHGSIFKELPLAYTKQWGYSLTSF